MKKEEEKDPRVIVREFLAEWQRQWTQKDFEEGYGEGFKEGHKEEREEMLDEVCAILSDELEKRFGDLPQETWDRLDQSGSFEKLVELGFAVRSTPSLAALGLAFTRHRS